MQKFPKIISYLEAHRPDVFELFNSLGMQADLNPKQKSAVTFLCPDAALCAKIRAVIEGPNPEDATDMLASLILTELYTSPSSMADGGVRTHLGKLLPVARIGSKDVKLAGGATVTPVLDPPFIPFSRKGVAKRDNMAIWNYNGEMWDYVNAEDADRAVPKKVVQENQGGNRQAGGNVAGARKQLIKSVQMAATQYYATNSAQFVECDGVVNPFVRASACILSNLRGDMKALSEVMPFIFTPSRAITFYALTMLVDEHVLGVCHNWQDSKTYDMNSIHSCVEEWMEFCATETPKPVLSTKDGQMQFYNCVLRLISDTPKSNLIHKKEMQTLETFAQSNKLVNFAGVLGKFSADAVRSAPNVFKLVNFASYQLVVALEEVTGCGKPQIIAQVLNDIAKYFSGSREAVAARVEGIESYDKMSNEFSNEDWQFVKRSRFCNSLLWSLPMHKDVAQYYCDKLTDETETNTVLRKAKNTNVSGSSEIALSSQTRSELREYLRLKGTKTDNYKDLL